MRIFFQFLSIFLYVIIAFAEVTQPALSTIDQCSEDLKTYFQDPTKPHVKKYLELQSDITAHRLAWSYMILWQNRGQGLEGVIKGLLKKRDTEPLKSTYEEFKMVSDLQGSRAIKDYKDAYLARKENQGVSVTDNIWQFRLTRIKQLKHSLIAASMTSMRATLIEDYAVPSDSPFLIQSEDIGLANLLSTVSSKEHEMKVLNKMTNLMETVDRTYDTREQSNKPAFKTRWRTADKSKTGQAGYQGKLDSDGLPVDASGTHHNAQARKIKEDLKKLGQALSELKDAVTASIDSCSEEVIKKLIATCTGDSAEVVTQKFNTFIQNSSLISSSLAQKFAEDSPSKSIIDALSRGGKVLENDDFNQKNFCDDPAKYLCDATDSRGGNSGYKRFKKIQEEAANEGIDNYVISNYICVSASASKDGTNCGQDSDCNCSTAADPSMCVCGIAAKCSDFVDMSKRKDCYEEQIKYQQQKIFTDKRKQKIASQLDSAKKDIIKTLEREPFKSQIPGPQRSNLITVIKDASLNFIQPQNRTFRCRNNSSTVCTSDSQCGSGTSSIGLCVLRDVQWNAYAKHGHTHSAHAHSPYLSQQRPEVWVDGMALLDSKNLRTILYHELGHLITSKYNVGTLLTNVNVNGAHPFEQQNTCLENDELSTGSSPSGQPDIKVSEAIADSLAAQTLGRKLSYSFPQSNPQTFNPRAIQELRKNMSIYCSSYSGSTSRTGISQSRTSRQSLAHPMWEDRINRILLGNKYIKRAVGCEQVPNPKRPAKYATTPRDCVNNP